VRGDSSSTDLWEVGADGTGLRRLTSTKAVEASPAYSSAGTLYFERDGAIYARFGRPPATRRVQVGTKPAFSTSGGALAYVVGGGVHVTYGGRSVRVAAADDPAWAPDGRRLVYAGADGLFTVEEDGTDRRRITSTPSLVHDLAPSWGAAAARRSSSGASGAATR
jgi:TolB protein